MNQNTLVQQALLAVTISILERVKAIKEGRLFLHSNARVIASLLMVRMCDVTYVVES